MQSAPVEVAQSSRRIVVVGALLALFLAAIDQTVVSTAMPRIISDLGGIDLLAWVFTSYMLASTIVVPLVGKLGDQFGRKPLFLTAIVVFLAGSFAAGAAQTMLQLVLFRALQGMGAGMLFATAFAVVGDLYAPLERGRIQGLFSAMFGLASVVGPGLGGWITDASSWRWVFYINLPVGIVAFSVVFFGMPWTRPHAQTRPRLDWFGAFFLIVTLLPFLLALVWAGDQYAWTSSQILGLFAVAAVGLVLFLLAERAAAEPILPLSLFSNWTFAISAIVMFLIGAGMFGAITMLPLFLQGVQGASAARAGTLMIPLTLSLVFASALSGQIMSRTGRYKYLVLIGASTMAAGLLLFSRLEADTSRPVLVRDMIVVGAGLGMTMPVFTVVVQNALPFHVLGVATSSVQFFRSVGGTIGVAVFTGLMLHQFRSGLSGTSADVPPVTDNLSKLLNENTVGDVQTAYEGAGGGGQPPWEQVLEVIRAHQAEAIALVFLVAAIVVATALLVSLFLPELELQRTSPAEMARRQRAAQDTGDATAPSAATSLQPGRPSEPPAAAPTAPGDS